MSRFYMTYARSRPSTLVPWIERYNVPLLTNAMYRWSDATERFLSMWEYDTPHVIDAGGYNVQAQYVDLQGNVTENAQGELEKDTPFYPWTIDEYHAWLQDHSDEFEWATVMDVACEDRFNELWDYEDRVRATLDATIAHFDKDPEYKLLPVLQGRSIENYIWFYEELEDYGIPTDHVGIGTICRLSSQKEIARVERMVRENTNVKEIHGFGAKIDAFKYGCQFDSADSQAWVYAASSGQCYVDDGDRLRTIDMPDCSLTRTVESFKNYYSYVTRLQQGESAVEYNSGVSREDSDEVARAQLKEQAALEV